MKKFLTLALLLGAIAIVAPAANAAETANKSVAVNAAPQIIRQTNRRWNRNGARVVTRTRIVRVGRQRYRETIQTRYLPNGRTVTRVISRVRIR